MERDEIIDLFYKKEFEKILDYIKIENTNDPWLGFFEAVIYEQEDYKRCSIKKADELYKAQIQRSDSISQAYAFYARFLHKHELNNYKNRIYSVLLEGLIKHGDDQRLIEVFIDLISDGDIKKYITNNGFKLFNKSVSAAARIILKYYELEDFTFLYDLLCRGDLKIILDSEEYIVQLVLAFVCYEMKDYKQASEIFSCIISYDVKKITMEYPVIGLVLSKVKIDDVEGVKQYIPNFLDAKLIDPIFASVGEDKEYCISFIKYYLEFIDDSLVENFSKDIEVYARLIGIRGYFNYTTGEKSYIRDLKYCVKHTTGNSEYYYAISTYCFDKNKAVEGIRFGIEYLEKTDEIYSNPLDQLEDMDIKTFSEVLKIAKKCKFGLLQDDKYFENIMQPIISWLFKNKRYLDIVELVELYKFENLVDYSGFKIAFSYSEVKNDKKAKKYYEFLHSSESQNSSAICNNLAIIYESESDFDKAVDLYEEAHNLSANDKAPYLKRKESCQNRKKEYEELMADKRNAVVQLENENIWSLNILKGFLENRDENGFIKCSYKLLPKFMSLNATKANEMNSSYLEKKYYMKVPSEIHHLDTGSTVYKVNELVVQRVIKIFADESRINDLLNKTRSFTINAFDDYDYDETLFNKLNSIKNDKIRDMLLRDIEENFIALLSESYKTSLVLSGSIIEAILLYALLEKGIDRYDLPDGNRLKKTKVDNMTLNDLLYVSEQEHLFSHEIRKHADAVRGYRNLIHPSVEIRKGKDTPVVVDYNAKIAWGVTLKVIKEVL